MKQIYAKTKTLLLLLTLLTLGAWNNSVCGATLTSKVAVGSGKGTATVEIYNGYGQQKGSVSSTNATVRTITFNMSAVVWAKSKYSATASNGYSFEGWYTNSDCTSGKQTDNPYETSTSRNQTRTDQYWAKFIPVTVNSVSPQKTTLTFDEPDTKTVTLTFNVSNADSKDDFKAPTISNNEWNLDSWSYNSDKVTVVVSFTVSNATKKGNDHDAKITLTSKGTSDKQSKYAIVSANVDMNPKFTCGIKNSYFVDDAALDLSALWTSTSNGKIKYTIESFTPSSTNNNGMQSAPTIANNMLSLGQAGNVELKLTQEASVSFNAGWTTKTITINKRDNAINATYKWRGEDHTVWTERLSFEAGAYVEFKSNNTEEGAPLIEVTPKTGTEFATFWPVSESHDENGDSFWSSWKIGEATWEVSQAENYKYKAATAKTFKIIVNVNDDPTKCSCNLYSESHDWGDERTASEIDSIGFGGIGDSLYFDMVKNLAAGNVAKYSLYTDGNWSGTTNVAAKSEYSYTHFGPIDLTLNGNTTAVKFAKSHSQEWWQWDTDDPYINNIKVTRKRWMKILDGAGKSAKEITSLPEMERYIDDDTVHVTFYVDFSTCDKLVKVASDYGHVTFKNNLVRDTIS